ncbi:hypothetical protein [Pseudoalteromonas atlantica]|uniref:hypothetical protein n=1 Tax=Pseudoalteromonas atlantica TaxID=288 RepID=UPI003736F29E
MANRIIKYTPIAASVALTLSLAGCGSDNDNKYTKPDPVTVYNAEVTTSFNTQVSGKAVKGSLKNAQLTVTTLNEAGETVPVAYRLAAADESFSAESTTSQADADASAMEKIVASNPEQVMTSANGGYTLFIEDTFTGPLNITVTTAKEGDDSFVKCDSFTGCGSYTTAPDASEEATMVNNGDTAIDFGEWYKDDLALQVVKFIKAPEASAESKAASPRFAEGDDASNNTYLANLTLYTSIAAKLLVDDAKNGNAVSDETIAAASLKTLIQVIGPDAAVKAAGLLGDISLGGAVDFTDIGEGDSLDAGTLALIQTAVSLQSVAGAGANGSLSDMISSLSSAVQEGKVGNSDNDAVKQIAAELQKAVENTSLIFAAVITGEGVDEAFAKVAENLGITDPEAIAKLKENATKAVEEVKAKAKEAGLDEDLEETAKEVKDSLEKIGCEENCDVGDDLIAKVAAELEASLTEQTTLLETATLAVEAGVSEVEKVKELGDAGLETTDQVITYSESVFTLSGKKEGYITLQTELNMLVNTTVGIESAASDLGDEYQQLIDNSAALVASARIQLDVINAVIVGVEAEVTRSDEAVEALGIAIEVAKNNVSAADTALSQARTSVLSSQSALQTSLIAVEAAMLDTKENAEIAMQSAESAITAASAATLASQGVSLAATQANSAANALIEIATEQSDKDLAQALIETASDSSDLATLVSNEASSGLAAALELKSNAQMTVDKFNLLVEVKLGTDQARSATIVTKTGGQALFDISEVIYDVLTEAWDYGDEGTDVVSTRYPDWTYSFDKDDLELDLENTVTGESVSVNGSINNKALIFAFGGMIKSEDGAVIEIETLPNMSDALEDCVDAYYGAISKEQSDSCLSIDFEEEVNSDTAIDGTVLAVNGWSRVEIIDGDSGFVGTLSLVGTDSYNLAAITASGLTSDLDFTATISIDGNYEEDFYGLEIQLHTGFGYQMFIGALDGEDFSGSVNADFNGMKMEFGQVTEITNGISVTYFDGEVIDYTDITFLDSSK